MKIDLSNVTTEQQNINTMNIDKLDTKSMVELINREDQRVIDAISEVTTEIANAIDAITEQLRQGGRLVYIGAGTSGRLGVLDASEVLPTFGVGEEMVIGLIAGGDVALRHPVEAAEDSVDASIEDLKRINFNNKDILCAIASSGRTPYCISGIEYAKSIGSKTISLTCAKDNIMSQKADYPIEVVVGQEVITGSTRMKSGSAQKMVLNMLTTGTMVKLGKVYGNLMVDVKTSNLKLIERARHIVIKATGCSYERAAQLLELSDNSVKVAIVMEILGVDYDVSISLLEKHNGHISRAISE